MAAKRTPSKTKRFSTRDNVRPSQVASISAMATNNFINMIAVTTVTGSVLFMLLVIKHF
jgi:hypothetical protein